MMVDPETIRNVIANRVVDGAVAGAAAPFAAMGPEGTAAVIGAVVGGVVAYLFGWFQQWRDRVRRRKAIATALLIELRWTDLSLRELLSRPLPGGPVGGPVLTMHEALTEQLIEFEPATVQAVMECYGFYIELRRYVDAIGTDVSRSRALAPDVMTVARLCVEAIPPAYARLIAEGGTLPATDFDAVVPVTAQTTALPPSPFRAAREEHRT